MCQLPERSEEPPESPLTLADLDELPVGRLRGVGAKREDALASIGIESVLDLLFHYPRRYVDRSRELRVADVRPGDEAMVMAVIQKVHGRRIRGGRSLVEATVADETGSLRITFFNQPWRTRQLTIGTTATFFGKVDSFRGQLQMTTGLVIWSWPG